MGVVYGGWGDYFSWCLDIVAFFINRLQSAGVSFALQRTVDFRDIWVRFMHTCYMREHAALFFCFCTKMGVRTKMAARGDSAGTMPETQ